MEDYLILVELHMLYAAQEAKQKKQQITYIDIELSLDINQE